MKNSSKKTNLNASRQNAKKKTVGTSTKKTTSKTTASKKTATSKSSTAKATPMTKNTQKKGPAKAKTTVKDKRIQKVYKNEKGKVIYRETTDKVGDVLVNGAGVKFKITGERRAKPTGYDDGKLKVRVLTISQGKRKMEFVDTTLKHYRDNKVLTRVSK